MVALQEPGTVARDADEFANLLSGRQKPIANGIILKGSVENPARLNLAKKDKIQGITQLSSFEFCDEGILTKKAAGVGTGQLVKISPALEKSIEEVSSKNIYKCQIVQCGGICTPVDENMDPSLCSPAIVKMAKCKKEVQVEASDSEEEEMEVDDMDENDSNDKGVAKVLRDGKLYKCTCSADFITEKNYERHIRAGANSCCPPKREMTVVEHLKRMMFSKFSEEAKDDLGTEENVRYFRTNLTQLEPITLPESIPLEELPSDDLFAMGFALAARQKSTRYNPKVKAFVLTCFNKGQENNQTKLNYPNIVSLIQNKFPVEHWLKVDQVKNIIKEKLQKLKTEGCNDLDPDQLDLDANNDLELIMERQNVEEVNQVLQRPGNWLTSHPLKVHLFHFL